MIETPEPKQIKIKLCFKYEVLTDKKRDWNDAKTACEAQKCVHSGEEWTFIKGW